MKCLFWCSHVSCLDALVFLWRRRDYGGSCKTSPFRRFPNRLWQVCHVVTFSRVCKWCRKSSCVEDNFHFSRHVQHFGRVHVHFAWQVQHFRRVVLRVFCESHCQGCIKWWQRANRVAGVGNRESVILPGRRGLWCRSVVRGISVCLANAVFRALYTLHSTLYTLHLTLHTLHFTL